jgi:hypothetical protein
MDPFVIICLLSAPTFHPWRWRSRPGTGRAHACGRGSAPRPSSAAAVALQVHREHDPCTMAILDAAQWVRLMSRCPTANLTSVYINAAIGTPHLVHALYTAMPASSSSAKPARQAMLRPPAGLPRGRTCWNRGLTNDYSNINNGQGDSSDESWGDKCIHSWLLLMITQLRTHLEHERRLAGRPTPARATNSAAATQHRHSLYFSRLNSHNTHMAIRSPTYLHEQQLLGRGRVIRTHVSTISSAST